MTAIDDAAPTRERPGRTEPDAQLTYLAKVNEAVGRLRACEYFLNLYAHEKDVVMADAAVLQMRKSLEATAFAAIAPNLARYQAFRERADEAADYRRDYNARAILRYLGAINPDFYPAALVPPIKREDGTLHYDEKQAGYLTTARFTKLYDRLGKFLHADNPWFDNKGLQNLIADLPTAIAELRELLVLHRVIIRTDEFAAVWIVEVPAQGGISRIVVGQPLGEFTVSGKGGSR